MKIARLLELIALASSRGVGAVEVVEDGTRVRISRRAASSSAVIAAAPAADRAAAPDAAPAGTSAADATDAIVAPMFGILHLTPAPGAPPFVRVGDVVQPGQQLCLIEAMKMFSPISSDRPGRVEAILVGPGEEVSAGQPLFRIGAGD